MNRDKQSFIYANIKNLFTRQTAIFTAEISAILTALKYIKGRKNDKFVIYYDSKSVLQALSSGSQDPFITITLDIL